MHDWVPFTASEDVVGWEDANPVKFNKKVAWIVGIISCLTALAFSSFSKTVDPSVSAMIFSVVGFLVGGFYKQILILIFGASLFLGICWALDFFKIVDFSSKPSENPPKVKKVNK